MLEEDAGLASASFPSREEGASEVASEVGIRLAPRGATAPARPTLPVRVTARLAVAGLGGLLPRATFAAQVSPVPPLSPRQVTAGASPGQAAAPVGVPSRSAAPFPAAGPAPVAPVLLPSEVKAVVPTAPPGAPVTGPVVPPSASRVTALVYLLGGSCLRI